MSGDTPFLHGQTARLWDAAASEELMLVACDAHPPVQSNPICRCTGDSVPVFTLAHRRHGREGRSTGSIMNAPVRKKRRLPREWQPRSRQIP